MDRKVKDSGYLYCVEVTISIGKKRKVKRNRVLINAI